MIKILKTLTQLWILTHYLNPNQYLDLIIQPQYCFRNIYDKDWQMMFLIIWGKKRMDLIVNVCHFPSPAEGECTSSESGLMMRSGVGKHTSADGATYTGEWREDKVRTCSKCVLHESSGSRGRVPVLLSLTKCPSPRVLHADAWYGLPAAPLRGSLSRPVQGQHVPRRRHVHIPGRMHLHGSI